MTGAHAQVGHDARVRAHGRRHGVLDTDTSEVIGEYYRFANRAVDAADEAATQALSRWAGFVQAGRRRDRYTSYGRTEKTVLDQAGPHSISPRPWRSRSWPGGRAGPRPSPPSTNGGSGMRSASDRLPHTLAAAATRLLMLIAPSATGAMELHVVAHPGLEVSADDLKEIYPGDPLFAGSVRLEPLRNAVMQHAFATDVLGMTPARFETWWARKSIKAGLVTPAAPAGDRETVDHVQRTPGAIGYVTGPPSGVRVIRIITLRTTAAGETR